MHSLGLFAERNSPFQIAIRITAYSICVPKFSLEYESGEQEFG
jgi:hypothetical protein